MKMRWSGRRVAVGLTTLLALGVITYGPVSTQPVASASGADAMSLIASTSDGSTDPSQKSALTVRTDLSSYKAAFAAFSKKEWGKPYPTVPELRTVALTSNSWAQASWNADNVITAFDTVSGIDLVAQDPFGIPYKYQGDEFSCLIRSLGSDQEPSFVSGASDDLFAISTSMGAFSNLPFADNFVASSGGHLLLQDWKDHPWRKGSPLTCGTDLQSKSQVLHGLKDPHTVILSNPGYKNWRDYTVTAKFRLGASVDQRFGLGTNLSSATARDGIWLSLANTLTPGKHPKRQTVIAINSQTGSITSGQHRLQNPLDPKGWYWLRLKVDSSSKRASAWIWADGDPVPSSATWWVKIAAARQGSIAMFLKGTTVTVDEMFVSGPGAGN